MNKMKAPKKPRVRDEDCPFEVRQNGETAYANPAVSREVAEKIAAQMEAMGISATIHERTPRR